VPSTPSPNRLRTNRVFDEAMEAGLAADHPVTVAAKQVRLELLRVKADLERKSQPGSSTARPAAWKCTGFRASAWLTLGTGDTASRHRMGSRASDFMDRRAPPRRWRRRLLAA
jgi:hypothetical protein